MQKIAVAFFLFFSLSLFQAAQARPDEPPAHKVKAPEMNKPVKHKAPERKHNQFKKYINNTHRLYAQLDLSRAKTPLNEEVFSVAYLGFQNLVLQGKIAPDNHLLSIVDFSLSSKLPRLWVIDLQSKKLLYNTLVAHGQGSGEEFAVAFSNIENSHQSSLGFYITDETYTGKNGYSLKLIGVDSGYNNNAYQRAIVIHGADYVCEEFIRDNNRLGRSWGCPALPRHLNDAIIDRIKGGSVFYIYHPNQEYLHTSKWINSQIPVGTKDVYLEGTAQPNTKNIQSTDTIRKNIPTASQQ